MQGTAKKWMGALVSMPLVLASGACTTTYTRADVEAAEQRDNARAKVEERVDAEIGATGGTADAITREELADEGEWMANEAMY